MPIVSRIKKTIMMAAMIIPFPSEWTKPEISRARNLSWTRT
jgi:hypothetical protein